jgi:hypothetical protein
MDTIIGAAKRLNSSITEHKGSCEVNYGTVITHNLHTFVTEEGEEVEFTDYDLGTVKYAAIEWAKHEGPRDMSQMNLHKKIVDCIEELVDGKTVSIMIDNPCWNDNFDEVMQTNVIVRTVDHEFEVTLEEIQLKFENKFPNFKPADKPTIFVRVWRGMVANIFINDTALENVAVVLIDEDVQNEETGEHYTVTEYTYDGVVSGLDDVIKIL